MKRTGEIALGVIGTILSVLLLILGLAFFWLKGQQDMINDFANQINQQSQMQSSISADQMTAGIANYGLFATIAAVIGMISGILAIIFIKGNKKPKLAGTLFIIGAVLSTLISMFLGIPIGILFLIAGIMCLVRKPKNQDI
ncbi:DUF4064 domain-containing protein [Tuberibacillus sp. Marseille-P3662]|uniref:DUF4064 domain-containing protein n=1 Tax=Tuberibacillus sp. Marseille-P3662 TaxID=1965358 RepID=UPI000A1CEF9F|nr:DUF4064 domain-containing protein [Tuberibacillus sp. Marseille-P3662]